MRLGIDVGGTKCLALAVDDEGNVLDRERVSTPRGDRLIEDALVALIETLSVRSGTPISQWRTIGLGVPGLISRDGVIVSSPNLPDVENFAVRARLESRLGRSVLVDNDANCAARAEWRAGAARGHDDVLVVTLGTGIGGGIVSEGRVLRGWNGFAGEIGHVVVVAEGRECACGRRGCWEQYASGSALGRLARDAWRESWADSGHDAIDLRRAAESGDRAALDVIDEFGRWVALGVASLVHSFDPRVVVIGGGVAHRAEVVRSSVERWLGHFLYASHVRRHPEVRLAEHGEDAGAIGAALLDTTSVTRDGSD
ncbi:MAG: ROK family protein [Ilumatobacteraceae bacterium]